MTHALPNKRKTTYTSQLLDPLQSERGKQQLERSSLHNLWKYSETSE